MEISTRSVGWGLSRFGVVFGLFLGVLKGFFLGFFGLLCTTFIDRFVR